MKNVDKATETSIKQRLDSYRSVGRGRPYAAVAILGCLLIFMGGVYLVWQRAGGRPAAEPISKFLGGLAPNVDATDKPTATAPDPLTGNPVDPEIANKPVVGVMIENLYPDARPQSGLGSAGVVYEALAEGGITRFLALFDGSLPPSIGPVRSIRPYYLTWGLEYDAPIAHAGGSQPALAAIKSSRLKNIEALVVGAPTFYRAHDRFAPHNYYTKNTTLTNLLKKLGWDNKPTFTPLPRKRDAVETPPSHPSVEIEFSTSPYAVTYTFDATSNTYLRALGGKPHIDRNSGEQIRVKNIVIEFVPTSYGTQKNGKPETTMQLVGSGKTVVLRDGGAVEGKWSKTNQKAPTKLLDGNGSPIEFNAGNTWYEIVPIGTPVKY